MARPGLRPHRAPGGGGGSTGDTGGPGGGAAAAAGRTRPRLLGGGRAGAPAAPGGGSEPRSPHLARGLRGCPRRAARRVRSSPAARGSSRASRPKDQTDGLQGPTPPTAPEGDLTPPDRRPHSQVPRRRGETGGRRPPTADGGSPAAGEGEGLRGERHEWGRQEIEGSDRRDPAENHHKVTRTAGSWRRPPRPTGGTLFNSLVPPLPG